MKSLLTIGLLLVFFSCKVPQLEPTRLDQLPSVHYIHVAGRPLLVGGPASKPKSGTVIITGAKRLSLVDAKGEEIKFTNEIEMMNFFAESGWRYVDVKNVRYKSAPDINYYLLEKVVK